MTAPADGDPVPDGSPLLRLPTPPPDYVPERWRPTHLDFRPSSEDERAAADTGKPVRLSVWDETLTTVAQARAFREADVLVLRVAAAAVRVAATSRPDPVDVVYDELPAEDRMKPGGSGHAGIEGLDRPPGESKSAKAARRNLRQAIADECEVVR